MRSRSFLFAVGGITLLIVVGASPVAMERHYFAESALLSISDTSTDTTIPSRSVPPAIECEYLEVEMATSQSLSEAGRSASQSPNEDTTNEVSNKESIGDVRPDPTSATEVKTLFTPSSVSISNSPTAITGATGSSQNDLVVIGAINASFHISTRVQQKYPTPPSNSQGRPAQREAPIVAYSHSHSSSCENWPTWLLLALICIILLLRWLVKSPQIEMHSRWFWPRHKTPTTKLSPFPSHSGVS
ncbi:hypothetical protein E1B28_005840 [Marasmius oreades]|uniref:Uncharacterized protein n=1 Tax=Marasmius oreades TaxID=181124 RepID=A0A9P7S4N9_9AGAR|nr:uncharacterized protein E1B28_005840 [Marasmius oreades]KAG7095050.1 hypothetical protein E1B28_005840 [Marasmius oreades]